MLFQHPLEIGFGIVALLIGALFTRADAKAKSRRLDWRGCYDRPVALH